MALWWGLFSIFAFVWVQEDKESHEADVPGIGHAVRDGFSALMGTLRKIRHLKTVCLFLLAYWFYIDGVDTIVRMSVDFGITLGFPESSVIIAILIVQFIAFPATMIYYKLSTKTGIKAAIYIGIIGYGVITFLGFFMNFFFNKFFWRMGPKVTGFLV